MSATIIVCDPEPFARSGLCQVANPPQYTGSAQLVPEANRPKRLNFRLGDWV
ncbi:hypothetical protein B0H14DRAFT_3429752 [Mycena olivaceomarginata]|nr:hypothetical protein B0H14DRAFT_3429752 [Mycena olivaceomarginata]